MNARYTVKNEWTMHARYTENTENYMNDERKIGTRT